MNIGDKNWHSHGRYYSVYGGYYSLYGLLQTKMSHHLWHLLTSRERGRFYPSVMGRSRNTLVPGSWQSKLKNFSIVIILNYIKKILIVYQFYIRLPLVKLCTLLLLFTLTCTSDHNLVTPKSLGPFTLVCSELCFELWTYHRPRYLFFPM